MSTVIIIPARYKSSRFPGKPLADIMGKSMLKRVWEKCTHVLNSEDVYVATDDSRIVEHCEENGMKCVITSDKCMTGTDRVAEAYLLIGKEFDTVINVQGDEPLISTKDIQTIIDYSKSNPNTTTCCGVTLINNSEDFFNPNIIKIVMSKNCKLLYASRAAIPTTKTLTFDSAYRQVCIYAFQPKVLLEIYLNTIKKSTIEMIEDIELLRVIENGYGVDMVMVSGNSIAVDIPSDIKKVERALKNGF